eukprot:CAMPEP_0181433704 /NCGR_PEP_ID=MMETSP1110-20121109/19434_1 /TAXON_ID=174948 /ORGANISM="Symbiodinium sp., Strain CCMP421" /LENGTH=57 /DNA_ID=CAMNT_0023557175 /DNA_START=112 /DNA_END=286 /DNA_ORIENTATION=+
MDELPVQLLGLLRVELLAAFCALELAICLDAHVDGGAIADLAASEISMVSGMARTGG